MISNFFFFSDPYANQNNSSNQLRREKLLKTKIMSNLRIVDPKMNPNNKNSDESYWLDRVASLLPPRQVYFHPSHGKFVCKFLIKIDFNQNLLFQKINKLHLIEKIFV